MYEVGLRREHPLATASSSTVVKAFQVLQLFREHNTLTASLCGSGLGIPRATAHRLLVSLRDAGAVEQTPNGHYRLSLSLFELGVLAPQRRGLGDRCGTDIEALADATGYRVHIGVLRELEVVYLDAAHGARAQAQGVRTRVGHRGPIHATAMGKVLLAFSHESLFHQVVAAGLRAYTPRTVNNESGLRAEMNLIRPKAVAFVTDQYVLGTAALAVPLRNPDGTVNAALSIVGDTYSMARDESRLVEQARQTAARIEQCKGATFRRRSAERQALVVST